MPKINVYLPDDLADAVRDAGIPVSAVCQRALEQAVRRVTAMREIAVTTGLSDDHLAARLPSLTARARQVLRSAISAARDGGTTIGTGHLLAAIIDEGNNMAVRVLRAIEADPQAIADDLRQRSMAEPGTTTDDRAFSEPAGSALAETAAEATALGHHYVGCEHMLLGLIADTGGVAGHVLRERGAELRTTRRAVVTALAGYVHGSRAASTTSAALSRDLIADVLRAELAPIVERIGRLERHTSIEPA